LGYTPPYTQPTHGGCPAPPQATGPSPSSVNRAIEGSTNGIAENGELATTCCIIKSLYVG
jgi:hypothetical protein